MTRPIWVCVDTSTYEELNFEWGGKLLATLADHAKKGRAGLLLPTVIERELLTRISKHAETADEARKRYAASARKLGRSEELLAAPRAEAQLDAMRAFFESTNATRIAASRVDAEELVRRHFERVAPFSAKKPDEFKDAIALLTLEAWAEEHDVEIVIASKDSDWQAAAAPRLLPQTLSRVLERLEAIKRTIAAEVRSLLTSSTSKSEYGVAIKDQFEAMWPVLADRFEDDAHADDLVVERVEIDEVEIVELDPEDTRATVSCDAKVTFSAEVRYGSDDSSYYDSEDKEVYFREIVEERVDRTVDAIVTIEVDIDVARATITVLDVVSNVGPALQIYIDDSRE